MLGAGGPFLRTMVQPRSARLPYHSFTPGNERLERTMVSPQAANLRAVPQGLMEHFTKLLLASAPNTPPAFSHPLSLQTDKRRQG
jgi:hypothetical protein